MVTDGLSSMQSISHKSKQAGDFWQHVVELCWNGQKEHTSLLPWLYHCLQVFYLTVLYEYQLHKYNTDVLAYLLMFSKKVLPLKCHKAVQNDKYFWTISILRMANAKLLNRKYNTFCSEQAAAKPT